MMATDQHNHDKVHETTSLATMKFVEVLNFANQGSIPLTVNINKERLLGGHVDTVVRYRMDRVRSESAPNG
uniref:HPr kinase/phosphorylase n=1 Tax=Steinernema glaseri TaxID=37863 RepID=A0A1I7Z8Y4_9BILA